MPSTGTLKAPPNRILLKPVERKRKKESAGPHTAMQMSSGLWRPIVPEDEYDMDVVEQYAHIVAVPDYARERIDDNEFREYTISVSPGDLCLVDHTLRNDSVRVHSDDKEVRSMLYHKVYAKVDGDELIPNCEWNFLEPLWVGKEEHTNEHGVTVPSTRQKSKTFGKVKWASESLKDQGIKKGDIVAFQPMLDYSVKFNEKEYYRVATEHILFTCGIDEIA